MPGGKVRTLTQLKLEADMKYIQGLQKKNRKFETLITSLQLEAYDQEKQKNAIIAMGEKLRKQLHFKSLVSSKVYYGKDCDKQMQENVKVQLRLLEHEYNRKRNMNSEMKNKNSELQAVIDEYRLRKMKMRESGVHLESKFGVCQEKMRKKMADANVLKMTNQRIEDTVEQLTIRGEQQINEQSAEILSLRETLDEHRRIAEAIRSAAQARVQTQVEMLQAGLLSMEQEAEMRRNMRLLRHGIADEAKRVEDSAQRILNHEMAFEKLREETGLTDLGDIVELFVRREDDNFAIYNHLQRVEANLQEEEHKLREVQIQTETFTESAKSRQGSTSNKYMAVQRQREQLEAKFKAQQMVKVGLMEQQAAWSVRVLSFLKLLVASGIEFQSELLSQPANIALIGRVRQLLQAGPADDELEQDDARRAQEAANFLEGNVETAMSIIEQCSSEIVALGMPYLYNPTIKTLNRFGMHSPAIGKSYDQSGRWTVDPPTFASLESAEDDVKAGGITPFNSTADREALVAMIVKKSQEKYRRATKQQNQDGDTSPPTSETQ